MPLGWFSGADSEYGARKKKEWAAHVNHLNTELRALELKHRDLEDKRKEIERK